MKSLKPHCVSLICAVRSVVRSQMPRWKARMRRLRRRERWEGVSMPAVAVHEGFGVTFTTASVPTICAREPTATARPSLSFAFSLPMTSFPRSLNLLAPSASAKTTYFPLACLIPCVTAPPLPRFCSSCTTLIAPGMMLVGFGTPHSTALSALVPA